MSVYSVLRTPRPAVYTGTLAELQTWGKIFGIYDFIVPSDQPDVIYRGNGKDTFANLQPMGAVQSPKATALNTTAAATSAAMVAAIYSGLITSTSAAAVTLTLPTATILGAKLGARQGMTKEFIVDNSAGANTATVAVATGITVITAVVTGSDTLTVAAGAVGIFRLYFVSATVAKLSRVQ